MTTFTRARSAMVTATIVLSAAACGGGEDASAADRDLAMPPAPAAQAQPDTGTSSSANTAPRQTAARPSTPARTTPPAPRPASTPAPPPAPPPVEARPVERVAMIPAGTEFAVSTPTKLCTNTHKAGDRFTATTAEAITGAEGASIPAGSEAVIQVVESVAGENDKSKVTLTFRVVSIEAGGRSYALDSAPVVTAPVERVRRQSTGDQAKKVVAGAAIGAVVGRVVGGNTRGAVAGAAMGTAAGAVAASGTADYDGCVAASARMTARLTESLRVR